MLFALALGLCAGTVAASFTGPSVRDSEGVATRAAVSPLAVLGPLFIANFETGLFLEHALPGPNDTGYPIRAVPYTAAGGKKLEWYTFAAGTPVATLFTIHTNASRALGVFVNSATGNVPSIRVLATQFGLTETSPHRFRVTLPFTTLALTAPDAAGSSPTLQQAVAGNRLQEWHIFGE